MISKKIHSIIMNKNSTKIEFINHVSLVCRLATFGVLNNKDIKEVKQILATLKNWNIDAILITNNQMTLDMGFILHIGIRFGIFNKEDFEESFKTALKIYRYRELTTKNKLEINLLSVLFSVNSIEVVSPPQFIPGFCHRVHFYNHFLYLFNNLNSSSKLIEVEPYIIAAIKQGYFFEGFCFTALSNEKMSNKYFGSRTHSNQKLSVRDSVSLWCWKEGNYE